VLGADSEVLDIGRLTKRWPDAIRRAITLRDRGCCFPGCDRPPSWTDVHHCRPWQPDGDTNLDNGALLCRAHHTFIHTNDWSIVIPQPRARPETRRPDRTRYEVERWPPSSGPTHRSHDP
jgi:5-methylcytosine-specific restriction protein A